MRRAVVHDVFRVLCGAAGTVLGGCAGLGKSHCCPQQLVAVCWAAFSVGMQDSHGSMTSVGLNSEFCSLKSSGLAEN